MGIFEFHQGLEGASAVVVPDMRWVGRCERLSVDWFCQTLTTVVSPLKVCQLKMTKENVGEIYRSRSRSACLPIFRLVNSLSYA